MSGVKPIGLSFEGRKRRDGWRFYTGRQKLLHNHPTRFNKDQGIGWVIDYFDRGPYNHKLWKDIEYSKQIPCGFKFDIGFGRWRWHHEKPFWRGLYSWFPILPYFYISFYRNGRSFKFGFETYLMDKFSHGIPQQGRNDTRYRAVYPRYVGWGHSWEAYNIYVRPVFRIK